MFGGVKKAISKFDENKFIYTNETYVYNPKETKWRILPSKYITFIFINFVI